MTTISNFSVVIKPLVSIIIPAHNTAMYIERTLRSAINQTYLNIEVIVIDDGSTDTTEERASSFSGSDPRVRVIKQNNQGVSVARNRGMKEAKGEYIVFLDSDDYLETEFVSTLLSIVTSSNSEISFCAYRSVTEDGFQIRKVIPKITEAEVMSGELALIALFKGSISIATGSAMYRKTFLEEIDLKFTPGATNGQDIEFRRKALLRAGKVVGTKTILFNYVIRKHSLVTNTDMSKFHALGCLRRFGVYLRKHTQSLEVISLFENYLLPRNYASMIQFFAIRGFSEKKLLDIARNPGYRDQLRKIRAKHSRPSEYLAVKGLLIFPKATIALFSFLGRRSRRS